MRTAFCPIPLNLPSPVASSMSVYAVPMVPEKGVLLGRKRPVERLLFVKCSFRTGGDVHIRVGCPNHANGAEKGRAIVLHSTHHQRVPQRVEPVPRDDMAG